jgi:hypothetical protein
VQCSGAFTGSSAAQFTALRSVYDISLTRRLHCVLGSHFIDTFTAQSNAPVTLMTRELGGEVACHPIDIFTAQQSDSDILPALLRASLLRSTCAAVHTDVLCTISAT